MLKIVFVLSFLNFTAFADQKRVAFKYKCTGDFTQGKEKSVKTDEFLIELEKPQSSDKEDSYDSYKIKGATEKENYFSTITVNRDEKKEIEGLALYLEEWNGPGLVAGYPVDAKKMEAILKLGGNKQVSISCLKAQ